MRLKTYGELIKSRLYTSKDWGYKYQEDLIEARANNNKELRLTDAQKRTLDQEGRLTFWMKGKIQVARKKDFVSINDRTGLYTDWAYLHTIDNDRESMIPMIPTVPSLRQEVLALFEEDDYPKLKEL